MPSYIEIDKSGSFPAASNDSKIILGIDTNGQIALTDNAGNTTPVSGGGITPSDAYDFILRESYNKWFYNFEGYGPNNDESVWSVIANEYDTNDYITYNVYPSDVNGRGITLANGSVTINHTNLTFRDDGYGTVPVNHTDFLNEVFTLNGLYTQFTGNTQTSNYTILARHCSMDRFKIVIRMEGVINGSNIDTVFYGIYSDVYGLLDVFGGDFDSVYQSLIPNSGSIWNEY